MNVKEKIVFLLFFGIFLILCNSCSNKIAKVDKQELYRSGIGHGVNGDFLQTKNEVKNALKRGLSISKAKTSLIIIKDVYKKNIKKETALHLFRSIDFSQTGDSEKELEELNFAIDNDKNYCVAYNMRGIVYSGLNQFNSALSDFTALTSYFQKKSLFSKSE